MSWVSVQDRLPESGKHVLVWDGVTWQKAFRVDPGSLENWGMSYGRSYEDPVWYFYGWIHPRQNITHWMEITPP